MNITSAQYIINELMGSDNTGIIATIDDKQVSVPLDPDNRHYAAIIEWAKEDSNEIAAAD